jgi:glycosyltransferase involved in cell wall biosynthesis
MRIALVDPLAYTPPYDHALASALAGQGHAVTLLTSRFPHGPAPTPHGYDREELFAPVSTRLFRRGAGRLALKGLEYPPSVARLLRRIERLDPDVVHVQWLPRPELDLRWLRRVADDRPVVLTAHDVLPRRAKALQVWPDVLETAERVIVHSQRAVEQLVELGLGRERIARIPHPVFEGEELSPPSGRTLLFFGLIRDYKGLDVLLEALPEIPDARLVVAGDPLDPVQPVDLDGRVEWRLGFRPDAEVRELMSRAAAVILPYRRLDSSGVLATAIGYRRPVVVTDVGSLGEIVREFGAGEVVPSGDPQALAQAIARLLEPKALAAAHAGAGRAATALTWEASAVAHDRLYREVRR